MEIVGEPDLRSPEEARDYLMTLRQILRYIGVIDRQHGRRRVPLRRQHLGAPGRRAEFGAKVEIKNMNSFRAVERALRYEVRAPARRFCDAGGDDRAGDARLGRGRGRHGLAAQQRTGARLPLLPGAGPAAADHRAARVDRDPRARCRSCPPQRRERFIAQYRPRRCRRRADSPPSATSPTTSRAVAGERRRGARAQRRRTGSSTICSGCSDEQGIAAERLPLSAGAAARNCSTLWRRRADGTRGEGSAGANCDSRRGAPGRQRGALNLLALDDDGERARRRSRQTIEAHPGGRRRLSAAARRRRSVA